MRIKQLFLVVGIGILVFSLTPVSPVSAQDLNVNVFDGNMESISEAGEPEFVIPATENEYLISDDSYIPSDSAMTRAITMTTVSFEKSSPTSAKASLSIRGDTKTDKLETTVYLLRKNGSSYDYIGKKSTGSADGPRLVHTASFSIEKKENYRIKVVITEYRGSTKHTNPALYKNLT